MHKIDMTFSPHFKSINHSSNGLAIQETNFGQNYDGQNVKICAAL